MAGASCVLVMLRDVAVDDSTSCSRIEENSGPTNKVGGGSYCCHDGEQIIPVDSVVGFAKLSQGR